MEHTGLNTSINSWENNRQESLLTLKRSLAGKNKTNICVERNPLIPSIRWIIDTILEHFCIYHIINLHKYFFDETKK